MRNLYLKQCAQFLRAALLGYRSGLQRRLIRELCVLFEVSTLGPRVVQVEAPTGEAERESVAHVPTGLVENTKWMSCASVQKPRLDVVPSVGGIYFPHAAELRRPVRGFREFYEFRATHSWLDVGLQGLMHVGWRPECSKAQAGNVSRSLPPDEALAMIRLDDRYPSEARYVMRGGVRRLKAEAWVVTGMARVDEVYMTVTVLSAEGRGRFCSGFAHGQGNTRETPVYMQEAAALHAIRVLKEWLVTVDHTMVRHVNIMAGDGLVGTD